MNIPDIFFYTLSVLIMRGSLKDCVMVLLLLCKGQMVYAVRERCGRQLAVEASVEADIVSTVPDSATPAALGYAQQVAVSFVLTSTQVEFSIVFCVMVAAVHYLNRPLQ